MNTEPSDTLAAALENYKIDLPPEQVAMIDRYCQSLWRVNKSLNLTRHTTYDIFVRRDVIDSLQIEPFLEVGDRVLDVGTGGGIPGILLAIFRSDLNMVLCDSVEKKAKAVAQIVQSLKMDVDVLHGSAANILKIQQFETLVARAVAPLKKMLTWLKPCWNDMSQLLLVKGPRWVQERGEAYRMGLLEGLELRKVAEYETPGNDHPSVILRIRPK